MLHLGTELLVGYIVLFAATKLLGKTQISQITPFDFVSALVLGELVGNTLYQDDIGMGHMLAAVAGWTLLICLTEFVTQRSRRLRRFLEGQPSLIVRKGQLDWKELRKNHLDVDQLMQLLRAKDVFSLQEAEYVILENDGTVSVLKKSPYDTPKRQDFQLSVARAALPVILISDGQLRQDIMHEYALSNQWLQEQLRQRGYTALQQICYAEWNGTDMYIQPYNA